MRYPCSECGARDAADHAPDCGACDHSVACGAHAADYTRYEPATGITRYSGRHAARALETPFFDAAAVVRRSFHPDLDDLPTRIGPIEGFFVDSLEKHHGIAALFEED